MELGWENPQFQVIGYQVGILYMAPGKRLILGFLGSTRSRDGPRVTPGNFKECSFRYSSFA